MNMPIKTIPPVASPSGICYRHDRAAGDLIVDEYWRSEPAAFQEKCQERMHHMLGKWYDFCSSHTMAAIAATLRSRNLAE